jgi:hypothetical protein
MSKEDFKEEINRDFKTEIFINKNELDEELVKQPQLYCYWAEQEAAALYERDKNKEKLDLVKAELDGEIRKNPNKYGIEKITESAISNAIIQNSKYKEANDFYLQSVQDARILGVAKISFDMRNNSLKGLVSLFVSGYWASNPKESSMAKDLKEEAVRKEHYESLKEGIRKRRG